MNRQLGRRALLLAPVVGLGIVGTVLFVRPSPAGSQIAGGDVLVGQALADSLGLKPIPTEPDTCSAWFTTIDPAGYCLDGYAPDDGSMWKLVWELRGVPVSDDQVKYYEALQAIDAEVARLGDWTDSTKLDALSDQAEAIRKRIVAEGHSPIPNMDDAVAPIAGVDAARLP